MVRFFLDTFSGDGSMGIGFDNPADDIPENPFRSAHADGAHSILDLKGGLCLVGAEGITGTPELILGDDLDERLNGNRKRALTNRLGVTVGETTLRGIVAELMILHGRDDGSRWPRAKQNRFGRHKIMLGQGQVVYDAPVAEGILGDTMVEGSNNPLEDHIATGPNGGHSYDELSAQLTVLGARDDAQANNAFSARYRADSALSTDAHYSQFVVDVWPTNANGSVGPIVQFAAAADSFYTSLIRDRADDQYRLFRWDAGSATQLGSAVTEALPTPPATVRFEVDGGGNLDCFMDSVSKITATDSDHDGNTMVGLLGGKASEFTDWEADDLGAPAAVYPPFPRHPSRRVRM